MAVMFAGADAEARGRPLQPSLVRQAGSRERVKRATPDREPQKTGLQGLAGGMAFLFLLAGGAGAGIKVLKAETGQEKGRGLAGGLCCPEAAQLFGMTLEVRGAFCSLLLHTAGPLGRSPLAPAQLLHLALQPSHLGLKLGPRGSGASEPAQQGVEDQQGQE